jgi:hypothetical protein
VLFYADDGAPARFHSSFHFKMAWIERSAEIDSERVPPPARRSDRFAERLDSEAREAVAHVGQQLAQAGAVDTA